MITAINNKEIVYLNPQNITDIRVYDFRVSDIFTYKKGGLLKAKGVYFGSSIHIDKTIENFLKKNTDYIADENNVIYEKPTIVINLINDITYEWHYDTMDALNNALCVFLDDLRTVCNTMVKINRNK